MPTSSDCAKGAVGHSTSQTSSRSQCPPQLKSRKRFSGSPCGKTRYARKQFFWSTPVLEWHVDCEEPSYAASPFASLGEPWGVRHIVIYFVHKSYLFSECYLFRHNKCYLFQRLQNVIYSLFEMLSIHCNKCYLFLARACAWSSRRHSVLSLPFNLANSNPKTGVLP